ncbi:MAG: MFS transporter [Anaerolineae bacterium]|nr:MFS transporter [Anaerolineae bacterium]
MSAAVSTPVSTRRERWSWYLYDFGNSAYASVVLLAVYSAYFQGQVVGGPEGSRLWGIAVGIAMLVVAVTAPILGAVADFSGAKKRFLFFFTALSCLFTASLFFATPGAVALGMAFFILAEIGYRAAQVFYDALLPEIAIPEEMGRVSGTGWAVGTAGGVVCLLIILPLVMIFKGNLMVRLSLVITAAFFAISTVPLFLYVREKAQPQPLPPGETYLSIAFKRISRTVHAARHFKEFVKFLVAYLIYNDGIMMIMDFAGIIGAVLFGLDQQGLIIFMVLVQVTNVVGAYGFGILVDRIGGKRSLFLSLIMLAALVVTLFFVHSVTGFFIIGALAGIAMAGAQSVSRTMVALLCPPEKSAEFYGFFTMSGRTSSFIGPTVYGIVAAEAALWFQARGVGAALAEQNGQRIALLCIAAFVLAGMAILAFVREREAREAAKAVPSSH